MIIRGRVWKFGDNINTDLIVPSKYLTANDPSEIVAHAFEGVREGFADLVEKGDIIVAGKNFGNGSSREEAVFVLKELGITAVVASSFARIYFRNLINNGIPAITLKNAPKYFEEGDLVEIKPKEGIIINLTSGESFNFYPLPPFILNILENGGTLALISRLLGSDEKKRV